MNYHKLIQLVSTKPELWDRCNPSFRDPRRKEDIWKYIANEMGKTAAECKDDLKHLREKYLREREKSKLLKDKRSQWELLPYLTFLDEQIIPRKTSPFQKNSEVQMNFETFHTTNSTFSLVETPHQNSSSLNQVNTLQQPKNLTQREFDELLVKTVEQNGELWDWKNSKFWNRQNRNIIWDIIASKLCKTPSECFMRWKALREKYIREKMKHRENKWELLDAMSFLDDVIQYRKPTKLHSANTDEGVFGESSSKTEESFSYVNADSLFDVDSSTNNGDSFWTEVKRESTDVPDSSYDSEDSTRKRRNSSQSSCSEKRQRTEKSAEELFGELVASLLTRKNESERHVAMIEIMKVLAK